MKLRVGTSGYSYKEWKGSFYPATLSDKKMLQFYAERFHAVEINYTFRAMPTVSVLEGWAEKVPGTFQFVLKAPQQITHARRLNNVPELVAELFAVAETLGSRLGPILFQLPPNMKKDVERLRNFLPLIPQNRRAAIEFRHQSWFDDEVLALLKKHRVAMCVAEADNELETPFVATADWGYVRLRRDNYSVQELEAWTRRFAEQQWSDAYVFFRHEDEAKGPRMAVQLLELSGDVDAILRKKNPENIEFTAYTGEMKRAPEKKVGATKPDTKAKPAKKSPAGKTMVKKVSVKKTTAKKATVKKR